MKVVITSDQEDCCPIELQINGNCHSAYQAWLGLGNVGTVQDFLNSLKGQPGENGADGEPGENGETGPSAYETWLGLGNVGTEQDFIDSLKGQPGQNGDDGENGADGENGQSAYETWLGLGNVGTEQDFIDSLKGPAATPVNYSTDEVYTGQKWIDGKPIYRKVFAIYFTQLQSEFIFTHYLDVSLENIENIIKTSTYAYDSDGTLQNDFTDINTNNNLIANFLNSYIESDSGNIISTGRLNSLTETTGYIILEYTKTTD